jgi:hypothetical protein
MQGTRINRIWPSIHKNFPSRIMVKQKRALYRVPKSRHPDQFSLQIPLSRHASSQFPAPNLFPYMFKVLWCRCRQWITKYSKTWYNDIEYNLNTPEYNTTKFKIINDSTSRCKSISSLRTVNFEHTINIIDLSR